MHIQTFVVKNLWHLVLVRVLHMWYSAKQLQQVPGCNHKKFCEWFQTFQVTICMKKCYISYFSCVYNNKPVQRTMYGSLQNKRLTVANNQWHSHSKSVKYLPQSLVIVTEFILNLGNALSNISSNCLHSTWPLDHVTWSVSGGRERLESSVLLHETHLLLNLLNIIPNKLKERL